MATILTLTNGALASDGSDPTAPLVNPAGPPVTDTSLSTGAAALNAGSGASTQAPILGLFSSSGSPLKNALFLGFVGYLIYKFGRRYM